MGFRIRDRRIRIGPGKAEFERRKRHAIDDDRREIGSLNPGVPLPSPRFERLNFKAAVNHGVSPGMIQDPVNHAPAPAHVNRFTVPRIFQAEEGRKNVS